MSLAIWLPLNGNLENKGLLPITLINNVGATIDANGKIGSCYLFNGSNQRIDCTIDKTKLANKEISIAMWYKYNEGNTSSVMIDIGADLCLSYTYNSSNVRFNYWRAYSNNGTRTGDSGSGNYYDGSKWHHVVLTCNHNMNKIYVDGALDVSFDRSTKYTSNWVPLLASSYNKITLAKSAGSNPYGSGYLNDVRIYDHCLSAAEVKEIAQGLVLHYKLDASSEEKITTVLSTNVYSYPTFNTSTASGGWNHWGPSGHSGSYGQNTDKKYIYNKNNTYSHWITEDAGTGKYYLLYQSPAFEGGYRSLQAIIKEENGLPITESICYPDWNARNGGVPNYKWTTIKSLGDGFYYCCCEGVSQDGSNDLIGINVQPGYKIYVSECYLENNTEICSPIFTYSSNIVQDSSGYNHNGEILNDVLISSDTPRYSTSTNLVAGNSAINCGRGGMVTDSITVNLWLKSSAWANPVSCTESGGWNFESSGDYFRFPIYISGVGYKYGISATKRTELCNNQWHMLTGVYDRINGHIKIYVDGELDNDYNAGTTNAIGYHGSNVIWLGAEASGSSTAIGSNGMAGLFSDFRIYCTPLLDTDIKQLYNVGMKVDNKQQIHTFELHNKSTNLLRSELIMPTAKAGYTSRIGEITIHNNAYAYNIAPAPFYKNISDSESGILKGQFAANTSYILDMWIDVDSVIYNGNNVAGGLTVRYTDGTSDTKFVLTGGNKGYQHKILITPNNKTVDRLDIYYYTSTDVFYRADSYIGIYTTEKIKKTGILDVGNLSEIDNITQFIKGGHIHTKQIIER